jgi:FkbM family methyltransferase
MRTTKQLIMGVSLLKERGIIRSILTTPGFSLTSFLMLKRLSKQGLKPQTIIDVGANIGQFAIASSSIYPQAIIYSFEPNPGCVAKMKRNVSHKKNINIFAMGLGDHDAMFDLHINSHSHSSSFLALSDNHKQVFPDAVEKRRISVNVKTLDHIFQDIQLTPPILLKLDVQGFEAAVLAGASETLQKVDYILVETSFKELYKGEAIFRDLLSMIEVSGFSFLRPIDFLTDDNTGEVLQMDALFCKS